MEYIVNESGVNNLNENIAQGILQLRNAFSELYQRSMQLTQALGEDAETMQQNFNGVAQALEEAERQESVIRNETTVYIGKVGQIHVTLK